MILILEFQQIVWMLLIVYLAVVGLPRQKAEVESVGQQRRVAVAVEGGGGRGWRRQRAVEAEGDRGRLLHFLLRHLSLEGYSGDTVRIQ